MKYRNLMVPSVVSKTFLDDFLTGEKFGIQNRLSSYIPSVNISEHDDKFYVEVAAPGLDKSDFNISVENDTLTVSSEKKSENTEEKKNYTRKEFSYNSFRRTFSIPDTIDADAISANYEKGILTINLPKKPEIVKSKSRLVEIG